MFDCNKCTERAWCENREASELLKSLGGERFCAGYVLELDEPETVVYTRVYTSTEYAVFGKTTHDTWRRITIRRFGSLLEAERFLEHHKKVCAEHPRYFESCKEYKIKRRTVKSIFGDWENVQTAEDHPAVVARETWEAAQAKIKEQNEREGGQK